MSTVHSTIVPRHRPPRSVPARVVHPLESSPELLLALAALLIVLAGPVLRAFAPDHVVTSAASVLVLGVGLLLAVSAAARLLRD